MFNTKNYSRSKLEIQKNGESQINYQPIHHPRQENCDSKQKSCKVIYQTITGHGDFKITILPAEHAPHIGGIGVTFLKSEIKDDFSLPATVWDYKMGKNFSFYIEHDAGNILFHPSAKVVSYPSFSAHADLVIQSIINRKSTTDLINSYFKPFGAKKIIPTHYDYFFKPLNEPMMHYSGVNLEEFKTTLEDKNLEVVRLFYGEEYIYQGKPSQESDNFFIRNTSTSLSCD